MKKNKILLYGGKSTTNATILPDLKIGKGAIVGAGSVVTKNVKPYHVVVGNPARFLKLNKKKYDFKIFKS